MRSTLGQSRSAGRWATWGLVALSLMITAKAGATTITETGTVTADTIEGLSGNNLNVNLVGQPFTLTTNFDPSTVGPLAGCTTTVCNSFGSGSTVFTAPGYNLTFPTGTTTADTVNSFYAWGPLTPGGQPALQMNVGPFASQTVGGSVIANGYNLVASAVGSSSSPIPDPATVNGSYSTSVSNNNTLRINGASSISGQITSLAINGTPSSGLIMCGTIACPTSATLPSPAAHAVLQLPTLTGIGSTVLQEFGLPLPTNPLTQSSLLMGYTAAASITSLLTPTLKTNVATLGLQSIPTTSLATLSYFVSVVPDSAAATATLVPVDAFGTEDAQAEGTPLISSASADAKITVTDSTDGFSFSKDDCANVDGSCGGCQSFAVAVTCIDNTSFVFNHYLTIGAPVEVDLSSTSSVSGGGLPSAFANSMVDPYFYVDPSFADAELYSIVVSSGVGNAPIEATVGEPPTAMMILPSISILIFWLRIRTRGRRKVL